MGKQRGDALQGALELLVLRILGKGPLHGYAIATQIEQVSEDVLRVEEGSLYPALHRIEQDGWVKSEWGLTETGRRARFYRLTPEGKKRFAEEEQNWRRVTDAVDRVLRLA